MALRCTKRSFSNHGKYGKTKIDKVLDSEIPSRTCAWERDCSFCKCSLFTLQDIVDFDVASVVDKSDEYSRSNYERSSLAAYTVVYMELHSNTAKSEDENCLPKTVSWKSII